MNAAEPRCVRVVRGAAKHWPFWRGRGLLPKLIERRLSRAPFPIHVQDGAFVIADWRDHMAQRAFYGDHLRDGPFQASLGLLHDGDTAIDVGANIGLWALPAARRVGSLGSVWALEPVPSTAQRLESGIALSGLSNATCARVALADQAAKRVMYGPAPSNSGGAGFIRRPEADTPLDIATTTLDDFCAARGLFDAVAVLKVDVEGAERLVFQGGERLLTSPRAPAVFFELDGTLTMALGWTPADTCATLRDFGYSIHRWDSGHFAEVHPGTEGPERDDLFAFKRGD